MKKEAGQSEPVEDSSAEAQPTMLRLAQHDPYFDYVMRRYEAIRD